MDIRRLDDLPPDYLDAYTAAVADRPGPPVFRADVEWQLRNGPTGATSEIWAALDGDAVLGGFALFFSHLDNPRKAYVYELFVHPAHRRRGIGGALFTRARAAVRAAGRSLVVGESPASGGSRAFVEAMGCEIVLPEARRTLDLRTLDWDAVRAAAPAHDGYRLERFASPAPEELLPDLVLLMNGMNDAPRGGDLEEEHYDLDRVREIEQVVSRRGWDTLGVLARRESDDAVAGLTRLGVRADGADTWAYQADTVVLPGHRGHRLGLALKLDNLWSLRERVPHAEQVITWNATSNRHMLAINEAMGFRLLDEWETWQVSLQR
ncbi:GNAT family N-acetyltransferase [Nonomuraea longicatena]|uniref:GNAT family N-acetyltransferase n=1 Tax=Nonomuraea longicatena TaxID=83682 RepID=A0ABN1PK36_9ACTN